MPFIPATSPNRRPGSVITLQGPRGRPPTLLKRYADFLDSTQGYIVAEALRLAFRRATKEFQAWLHAATHTRPDTTAMSFDLILPFLRPIAHLIRDPAHHRDHGERIGAGVCRARRQLEAMADVTVARAEPARGGPRTWRASSGTMSPRSARCSIRACPMAPRVAAALPPVSLGGTTLTIRKFQSRHFAAEELVQIGTLTRDQLDTLRTRRSTPATTS